MGNLQTVTKHYRTILDAGDRAAADALQTAYQSTWARIKIQLDAVLGKLQDAIANGDDISPSWLYEANRLQGLLHSIGGDVSAYAARAQAITQQQIRQGLSVGLDGATALLDATIPAGIDYTFGRPSPDAMKTIVGSLQDDSPLNDLFASFDPQAQMGAKDALIAGVTIGRNPNVIASDVRDALNVPLWRAQTIARTEMLRAYRTAASETFKANADVVSQWRWVADKSVNTCGMCLAMDGTLHDLDEDLDSHPNCGCVQAPVTKDWSDILGPLGIDTADLPAAQSDYQTGSDWFADQDESAQRQILGPSKYAAYQAGDLALSDLVGHGESSDWGGYRYEKSMKDLGLNADDYAA